MNALRKAIVGMFGGASRVPKGEAQIDEAARMLFADIAQPDANGELVVTRGDLYGLLLKNCEVLHTLYMRINLQTVLSHTPQLTVLGLGTDTNAHRTIAPHVHPQTPLP